MRDFEDRKDIELKAKMETDEIKKQLRLIQKSRLEALEKDKASELERLAAEREAIRLKEQNLLSEIERLRTSIVNEEEKFRLEADQL